MNDGYRHSMCLDCWRKKRRGMSAVGHKNFYSREREKCCFCGNEHRSGIHVAKDPKSSELKCGNLHDHPRRIKVIGSNHEASVK